MNKRKITILFSLAIIIGVILYYAFSQERARVIILRIRFSPELPVTVGAVHDGFLTISNVGRRDIHNVYVKYEKKTGEWYPPTVTVFFGDIYIGENKTAFVEDFYFIPRWQPELKRFPVFQVIADEGTIRITTDDFQQKEWKM